MLCNWCLYSGNNIQWIPDFPLFFSSVSICIHRIKYFCFPNVWRRVYCHCDPECASDSHSFRLGNALILCERYLLYRDRVSYVLVYSFYIYKIKSIRKTKYKKKNTQGFSPKSPPTPSYLSCPSYRQSLVIANAEKRWLTHWKSYKPKHYCSQNTLYMYKIKIEISH